MPVAQSLNPAPLLVACLCAEWCGVCREFAPVMVNTLAQVGAQHLKSAWVDIEDHDEVVGDLDVQNFPTLLIARGSDVLFFGTVTPHGQTLERLVRRALAGELPTLSVEGDMHALVGRVQAFQAAPE